LTGRSATATTNNKSGENWIRKGPCLLTAAPHPSFGSYVIERRANGNAFPFVPSPLASGLLVSQQLLGKGEG